MSQNFPGHCCHECQAEYRARQGGRLQNQRWLRNTNFDHFRPSKSASTAAIQQNRFTNGLRNLSFISYIFYGLFLEKYPKIFLTCTLVNNYDVTRWHLTFIHWGVQKKTKNIFKKAPFIRNIPEKHDLFLKLRFVPKVRPRDRKFETLKWSTSFLQDPISGSNQRQIHSVLILC